MKPRHAAALALVGWYLMMPPANGTEERLGASMSMWTVYDSYDTAAECRKARDSLRSQMLSRTKLKDDPNVILRQGTSENQMVYFAECIASDDPRLKEK